MSGPSLEREVRGVLEAYAEAIRSRDRAAILALFTDDAVAIGTGPDEWYHGQRDLSGGLDRDLAQAIEVQMTYGVPQVASEGDVAWAAVPTTMTGRLEGGGEFTIEGRATAVLVRRNDQWRIAQSHLSVPAADQIEGHSYPEPH